MSSSVNPLPGEGSGDGPADGLPSSPAVGSLGGTAGAPLAVAASAPLGGAAEGVVRGGPSLVGRSLESASAFVAASGLLFDEVSGSRVTGHIELSSAHHTPWGIVHGGVYATAIESAASVGATKAVEGRGMIAVGLTNTTHFLRSVTSGRAQVEATALNQGRTQQLWRVDVADETGRLLAHGEVRLQNVTPTSS